MVQSPRIGRLAAPILLSVLLAGTLAGCAKEPRADSMHTGSIGQPMTEDDFERSVKAWAQRYDADPKDKTSAINYAAALRRTGRTEQAVAVLRKAAIHHPSDRDVLSAYGKTLAANGSFSEALETVRRAQTPDRPDWQLMSAEAAILDQVGKNAEARRLYKRALDLAPNEASVHSNLGMSYVLTGDLKDAEAALGKAVKLPGADSRVRQNLALVVGLQGRFDEAEKIAAAELSPDQARANVAYLRSMLSQSNSWQKLRGSAEAPAKKKQG